MLKTFLVQKLDSKQGSSSLDSLPLPHFRWLHRAANALMTGCNGKLSDGHCLTAHQALDGGQAAAGQGVLVPQADLASFEG